MSPPRHLLTALYAVLRLFKLPRGFRRKLLLRCELLYSKLRCLLFGLLRGYSVRDGSSESAHTKNRQDSQWLSDKVSDSETLYIPKSGQCHELENQFARIDDGFAVGSCVPQDIIPSLRSHGNVSSTVSASAVPSSASVVASARGHYPPARRGSSSYPDIRQSLAPLTTTSLAPRPRSINVPSPSPSRHASSLHLPHFTTPTTLSPSPSSIRLSIAELSADQDRAQARTEFIEADARSERRVRRSRAPARSAVSGSTQSRTHSRQSLSRPSSRARPPSMVPQYPSSATGSRISLTPSEIGVIPASEGYSAHSPFRISTVSRTPSSLTSSSAPSIQLEPPSPEQERRSSARRSSDMIGLHIQSPSSESLHSISDRYASPSPTVAEEFSQHMSDRGSEIITSNPGALDEQDAVDQGFRPDSTLVPNVPPRHTLQEIIPLDGPRYTRQVFVSEVHYGLEVPPLCLDFPHSPDDWQPDPDLQGWVPVTHPEGGLYFHHKERRIFTEAYLFLPAFLEEVELLIDHLQHLLKAYTNAPLAPDCELVVHVTFGGTDGEKDVMWQYYYVDHRTRSLFWLRHFQVGGYLGEVYDDVSPAHFKHLLETWYWDHVSMLPDNFGAHDALVEELVGHLTYYCVDQITSPNTTVPYTLKELANMIRLLSRKEPGAGAAPIAAALGRIMSIFCHWRFVHYHGQRCARLDRLESVREASPLQKPRTWLMKLFSFLFLFAPEVHLRDIEKVYVDEIITSYIWKRHISKLQSEWEELIAYATIILTASVSMLSVPDVILFSDNPNPPGGGSNIQSYLPPLHSPAAIASYISIMCSIGSIVLGLMLVHHNRTKNREDSHEAAGYMKQQDSSYFHHEPLAILYSLPYALLMWSMLSFATSVMIFTLDKTDMATQSTIAVIAFGISCLIVWCIAATWDSEATPRLQKLWNAAKRMSIHRRSDSDHVSSTVVDSDIASEKSGSAPRRRLYSLAKKIRETRIPCVNDV